ncbi:sulfite exporter TauE/SafE family protein [Formosa sediminum]|uniref:Sulfite exporter TauE/SafE family protein n=1 Tax=Formosa sediminum TaxID=2594004 RepID=A0A516GS59_9FLAO|nr:sulfite exporter TauE/SafE family protein [Formosa sediminum]QDO94354.1 sulfite exporter TauE/SafE family protein [Formosa sediminum]
MFISAFIFGLLGSFHCIGMCGPIAFMLPVDRTHSIKKISQIFTYHFGRLLAYSIIGLVFGILGKGLYVFGLQQKLSIVIGVLLIVIVLLPYKTFNTYNFSKPIYKIISKVKKGMGVALQKKTADTFLTIGFLNGFLPCGLVYMAVLSSIATAQPLHGAFYMFIFGLGTIPLMTSAIYFGNMLTAIAKKRIQKLIPAFVIIIGVLFIFRGLGLGIPYISPNINTDNVHSSMMECAP